MSKNKSVFLLLLLCAVLCLTAASASGTCTHGSTHELVIQAPTCVASGTMAVVCNICGDKVEMYPIEPLGHDIHLVTVQAPTCTQSGKAYEECSRCGPGDILITVPATGHRAGNSTQINVVSSTCTQEGGYDLVVYCDVCHEVMEQKHVATPAAGHVPGNPVKENQVEASCTQEGGYEQVVRCSVCGTELERTHVSTGGGYHSMGFPYIVDEPTCMHEGHAAQDCVNCGYTESWPLDRTGHTWPDKGVNEKQVYPTCDKIGTYDYVHYCTVCGTELKREKCTWKALGHDWGDWIESKKATPQEDGLVYRICANDSNHRQERLINFEIKNYGGMGAPEVLGHYFDDEIYSHEIDKKQINHFEVPKTDKIPPEDPFTISRELLVY